MANSTTHIDLISQSQASKEVTANAFFDAASQATLYGRRQSTCAGLTWGYYGGTPTLSSGSQATIANATLTLTAATTCYIVALKSSGAVSFSTGTTNWNDATNYWRLYSVVTGAATVTSYTDARELGKMTGGGGGSAAAITVKDEGSNLTTSLASIDFVGTGVAATAVGDAVTVTINTPTSITVNDEGSSLTTALSSLNFVGAGVTATNTGGAVTVSVSGGTNITAKDEGTTLTSALSSLDFVGAGVTATNVSGAVTVTVAASGREKLTADRTYYVRTDGSDSNNGLADTSGGAFLTLQKAMNVISDTLDLAGYIPTIKVADGTYTGTFVTKPLVGGYKVTVNGNSGTPANVLISTTSATAFANSITGLELSVENLKITTTTSGQSLSATRGGIIKWSNLNFGACAGVHVSAQFGGRASCYGNYAISGAASAHWDAYQDAFIECVSRTVTLSGTPAITTFASSVHKSEIYAFSNTFSGSATGTRYAANNYGFIFVNGAATTIFPGDVAGTADGASFGRYA
jgi:hypothetical protein